MSDNIVKLADYLCVPVEPAEDGLDHETFLVEEGLDLLAAYRSISDKALRLSLKAMVETMAKCYRKID